jgi:hypothetical protein
MFQQVKGSYCFSIPSIACKFHPPRRLIKLPIAQSVNIAELYLHFRLNMGAFRIMDAIWMLAAEAKPHTHSAIAAFG